MNKEFLKKLEPLLDCYSNACAQVVCSLLPLAILTKNFEYKDTRDLDKEAHILKMRSELIEIIAESGIHYCSLFDLMQGDEPCIAQERIQECLKEAADFISERNIMNLEAKIRNYKYELSNYQFGNRVCDESNT